MKLGIFMEKILLCRENLTKHSGLDKIKLFFNNKSFLSGIAILLLGMIVSKFISIATLHR
jgi:hypothetical protein